MGRERGGAGQQVYLFFALLILVSPWGCSLNRMVESRIVSRSGSAANVEEARKHLSLGREFLAKGDYGNALRENEKATSLAGHNAPADEAIYFSGVIYAYPANPLKDNGKSLICFKKLIREYPKSELVKQAQAMVGLLQENDKNNKMIERLNKIIEESNKVDRGIEQRRREKK